MRKLLILAFLGLVFYFFLRNRRGAQRPSSPSATPGENARNMVSCAQCGLHLPADESFPLAGQDYCCEKHRSLGPRERKR